MQGPEVKVWSYRLIGLAPKTPDVHVGPGGPIHDPVGSAKVSPSLMVIFFCLLVRWPPPPGPQRQS